MDSDIQVFRGITKNVLMRIIKESLDTVQYYIELEYMVGLCHILYHVRSMIEGEANCNGKRVVYDDDHLMDMFNKIYLIKYPNEKTSDTGFYTYGITKKICDSRSQWLGEDNDVDTRSIEMLNKWYNPRIDLLNFWMKELGS
jgi:hypothetical protein